MIITENKKILSSIVNALKTIPTNKLNDGLMSGKAGIILFLIYFSVKFNKQEEYDFAINLLKQILNNLYNNRHNPNFATGLSGIGWLLEHLSQNNLIEFKTNKVLSDIDEYIYKSAINELANNNYDFLNGACGMCLFLLQRSDYSNVKEFIRKIIIKLDDIGIINVSDQTIKWKSYIDIPNKIYGYNISISHGIAGIIILLSKIYNKRLFKDLNLLIEKLIRMAVNYILDQRNNNELSTSVFPSYAHESLNLYASSNSRLAWCYGDLGIALSLSFAGYSLCDNNLQKIATEIFIHSTKRKDLYQNRVFDACLCHGSSGLSHIFNSIYLSSGNTIFLNSSKYWEKQTINFSNSEDGYAGYKTFSSGSYLGNQIGLLLGISGIGLSLISNMDNTFSKWDECLLLR